MSFGCSNTPWAFGPANLFHIIAMFFCRLSLFDSWWYVFALCTAIVACRFCALRRRLLIGCECCQPCLGYVAVSCNICFETSNVPWPLLPLLRQHAPSDSPIPFTRLAFDARALLCRGEFRAARDSSLCLFLVFVFVL